MEGSRLRCEQHPSRFLSKRGFSAESGSKAVTEESDPSADLALWKGGFGEIVTPGLLQIRPEWSGELLTNFIRRHPAISSTPEIPSLKFIKAARFLKNNAPHPFQIREMGAKSEDNMDRWLWDFLEQSGDARSAPAK
jgi:hypothetical protein